MAISTQRLRVLTEVRAVAEFAVYATTSPLMERWLPRANRPVFVMPGFLSSDRSTARLRATLSHLGHTTYGWDLGTNLGPTPEILDGIIERLDDLYHEHGPIDVIGWSLGGIFARELARLSPHSIRQVITLGSPFQIRDLKDSNVSPLYQALSHRHVPYLEMRVPSYIREPLEVPTTSIYTRTDGIVRWHHCLNRDLPRTENIEVYGSHCGLGHNPSALIVVADRLALPLDEWHPYQVPWSLQALFPSAPKFRIPVPA